MRIFKKSIPRVINLKKIIPINLKLYDSVTLELKNIEIDKISADALEDYFRKSHCVLYTINGEIHGQALALSDSRYFLEIENNELGLNDIFLESSNIIIEEILKRANDGFDLVSYLSAPMPINNNRQDEQIKRMRILSFLNKSLARREFYQLDYFFTYEDFSFPIRLFFMININETTLEN